MSTRQLLRLLWRDRATTLVAAAVLALGIGASTAMFTVVNVRTVGAHGGCPRQVPTSGAHVRCARRVRTAGAHRGAQGGTSRSRMASQ